jgi:serine/threonine protein kinase/tetratricopeptide (TPR) repeat protein
MLQPPQPHNEADPFPMAPPLDPIATLRAALSGHYEIEREIGQGAFATVYLARDLKHERKVAVKVLHADPTSETGELRFIREIRLLARLQHPNILPLHDSGHVETLLYYVMPYVSGETLRDRIDRERQLVPDVACNIARDVADALAYAHAQGVIHRDIKPENILLSAGHPVLADFGIARAIDLAGVRQLTRTGRGSPGTPAYMSPEQLMGDKELDGRSDTYSLGCVLFEMLTGKPPFAGKEGFVKRFTEDPPRPSSVRKDLVPWIDDVVTRALAKSPDDRYQTAQELATALTAADATSAEPHAGEHLAAWEHHSARSSPQDAHPKKYSSEEVRLAMALARGEGIGKHILFSGEATRSPWLARIRKHSTLVVAAILGLLLVAIAIGAIVKPSRIRGMLGGMAPPDTTRFVILPVSPSGGYPARVAERLTTRLYDSFRAWEGLTLISDADVDDVVRNHGGPPSTLADALNLARRLGAGRMVWSRVVGGPNSPRVRAELYDVARNASAGRFALLDSSSSQQDLAQAAITLLALPDRPRVAQDGDGLTHSYSGWTAYNLGHAALSGWDLAAAAREFGAAVSADSGFSAAHLWLAQVQSWVRPDRPLDWKEHAAAASQDSRLPERDQIIARSLVALADQRHPVACQNYATLTKANPSDFLGWYGLGECQAFDSTVIELNTSPSGWRFRSSYRAAADAYMHALKIDPRAHAIFAFDRLQALLPTSSTKLRVGRSEPPNRQTFLAYPSLEGVLDTLGFVPYPVSRFAVLPAKAMRTKNRALDANTKLLLEFARNWTQQSPTDPAAFEAFAEILETSGEITGEPFEQTAVMTALRQARAVTRDTQQLFRTAAREVWLRFKREDFAQARRLADSLLIGHPKPSEAEAHILIAIAALTGKLDRAVAMARLTQAFLPASPASPPPQVRDAATELFINAALGICGDRISRLEKQLDDAVVRYVPAERAAPFRADLMERPLSMTVPCTAGRSALNLKSPDDRLLQAQQAYARDDLRLVRALLDTVAEIERIGRPGDISLDYTYQLAWLRVALGDTAVAIRLLDNSLDALPALSSDNLQELAAAAAVGRAMELRARLAAARGDPKTAQRWARGLAMLWETADAPLRTVPNNLRSLTKAGPATF